MNRCLRVPLIALLLALCAGSHAGTVIITDSNGDEYQFTIRDELRVTDGETLVVPVAEFLTGTPNTPPIAVSDQAMTDENMSVTVNLAGNDSDPDGSVVPGSIEAAGAGTGGTWTFNTTPGSVLFQPANGFTGSATQPYVIYDNQGARSNLASVQIQVIDVADCPSNPLPGLTRKFVPLVYDHCQFGVVSQLNLMPTQYYALEMTMLACPEDNARIFYGPDTGGGFPLRVTISRCPGVFDDSHPPVPGSPFLAFCSRPSVAESTISWTLTGNDFSCAIDPGQEVYLNVMFGDNGNPPTPACPQSSCPFILQPLQ